jgi:hypothetical protein
MSDYTGAADGAEDDDDLSQQQKTEKELDNAGLAVQSLASVTPPSPIREAIHKDMSTEPKK